MITVCAQLLVVCDDGGCAGSDVGECGHPHGWEREGSQRRRSFDRSVRLQHRVPGSYPTTLTPRTVYSFVREEVRSNIMARTLSGPVPMNVSAVYQGKGKGKEKGKGKGKGKWRIWSQHQHESA